MARNILFAVMLILNLLIGTAAAQITLRVGYIPATGFLESDRPGHLLGYGYEYMEFLSRYCNRKFEYVPCTSWNECNEKLQSGVIDLLPAMPGDYRSLQNVKRTDHVIGRYPMSLITHDGTTKPQMKIGTTASNAPIPSLPKIAKEEGFEYELINYPFFYDVDEAFSRREIDGYIFPMTEPNKAENVAAIFDRQSYRLLVRSDRKDLLDLMNIAMDEMLTDQPNIRNRLNDKYLRNGGAPLILNRPEKEYLKQKKKLKTAILMHEKPYAYYENGKLKGVIPRVIKQISEDLNIEIEITETHTPAETSQLIQNGTVDFIADSVCDFSWAGNLNMAPTQSYLQLEYVPVTRRNSENKSGVVACAGDLLYTKTFVFSRYPEDKRLIFSNLRECFKAVSDGQADILFAPRSEANYMIEETGSYNLDFGSESSFSDSLSLGVYTGADTRLWRILNKEVNHLDIEKIRSSVNDDLIISEQNMGPKQFIYHNPLKVMTILIFLTAIITAFSRYRIRKNRKKSEKIEQMAYTDLRTGLPNLEGLKRELPKIYAKFEDGEENLYIAAMIADRETEHFRSFSENLKLNQILNMAKHLQEYEETVFCATGKEINDLICVLKCKTLGDVSRIVREVIQKYGCPEFENTKIWQHFKTGIFEVNGKNLSVAVDKAQITAQRSQKEILIFNEKLDEDLELEKRMENLQKQALENGEFQIWYQTEYDIKTQKSMGAEAFIRWQSPELGFLMPEKFISVFERNGFIVEIDYFVLEEVCKLQRERLDEGKEILPIAINQSRLHILEEGYTERVRKTIAKYNLPKHSLKMEFSSSSFEELAKSYLEKRVTGMIGNLRKLGFKISIDNFGRGYSSYKLLSYLSFDEMKIDRSLLYSAKHSERARDILENIIHLGEKLGMKIICEGVETKEQENLLLKCGCRYGQGFINAEPMQSKEWKASEKNEKPESIQDGEIEK